MIDIENFFKSNGYSKYNSRAQYSDCMYQKRMCVAVDKDDDIVIQFEQYTIDKKVVFEVYIQCDGSKSIQIRFFTYSLGEVVVQLREIELNLTKLGLYATMLCLSKRTT